MARKTREEVFDDIDGEIIEEGDLRTTRFSFDGVDYKMDLRLSNFEQFEADIAGYIERAEKVGGKRIGKSNATITSSRVPAKRSAADMKAIREWANENDYSVSSRGRIPDEVMSAYDAAH